LPENYGHWECEDAEMSRNDDNQPDWVEKFSSLLDALGAMT
jgi:hypothetical protein